MRESHIIPTQAATDLPTFTILVEGEDIGQQYGILGIMVTKSVNRIPKARLILSDGDVAAGDFSISSGNMFIPGNEVEIKAGYHNNEDTIFRGIITGQSIKALENRNPFLQIDMRDKAVKMTAGRNNRYFEAQTDSEIIEELIGNYGLEHDVEPTGVRHDEMVQYHATDWDFVVSRAEVNGSLVFADDGKIDVKKPDPARDQLLTLAFGSNVIAFEAGIDARDQHIAYSSRSWNYSVQQVIEEEADEPDFRGTGNISAGDLAGVTGLQNYSQQHGGKVGDSELKAWSDSRILRSRLAKVRGRVRINGFSDIKPGHTIKLEGFGDRFNGVAFVSAVSHEKSSDSSWYTDIGFGLDPEWHINRFDDIATRQASGLIPPVHGLQAGVVTNIHEDPDGEDRIRVRIPVIDPEHDGVWARIASPDAGESRGMVFRPEVGDEVIVGCINDDPRDPVIIGMLHSSNKPSPIPAEESNPEKGFVTGSELKFIFNDEKRSITLISPNGNKWILSDDEGGIKIEDENSNKITLSSDGITIESTGDLNLKASGDVTIQGTNVDAGASSGFKAEGGTGAELSSNGQTVVKGSIVAIN